MPLGVEFQVNSFTTNAQQFPDVALAADDSFVVVWTGNGQDGADRGIFGQRYDAGGVRVGVEFQVNLSTSQLEAYPRIAVEANGDFVVVWSSRPVAGGYLRIDGLRFTSSGAPLGSQFVINTYTASDHRYPVVATDS